MIEMKSFSQRLIGLMFRSVDDQDYLFRNCRSIHTLFMKETIVVLALNKDMEIIDKVRIEPYQFKFFKRTVKHIIECKQTNYVIGDKICVESSF